MLSIFEFIIIIVAVIVFLLTMARNLNRKHTVWQREVKDYIIIGICIAVYIHILYNSRTDTRTLEDTEALNEILESMQSTESEDVVLIPEVESEPEPEPEPEPILVSLDTACVTGYCSCKSCCGKWADVRPLDEYGNPIVYGASGEVLIPNYSVAVDPNVIPYGTKIYISGQEYIAHDCGGSIDGNDIDIYFSTHEEAYNWGQQYIEIFILLEEGES